MVKQKCNYCLSEETKTMNVDEKIIKIKLHKKDCMYLKLMNDNAI
jgi:hypothetical protein